MTTYYQTLHIKFETDFLNKSEDEIQLKIEQHFKASMARVKHYKEEDRLRLEKQLFEARDVLKDPVKRKSYTNDLTKKQQEAKGQQTTIEYIVVDGVEEEDEQDEEMLDQYIEEQALEEIEYGSDHHEDK